MWPTVWTLSGLHWRQHAALGKLSQANKAHAQKYNISEKKHFVLFKIKQQFIIMNCTFYITIAFWEKSWIENKFYNTAFGLSLF